MLTAYLVCLALGGILVGLSALGGLGKDLDKPDLGEHDLDAHAIAADLAVAGPTRGEADPRRQRQRPRRWSPLGSPRFWTFGGCFFGLTGTALTHFTTWGAPAVALASTGVGVSVGASAAWVMSRLRTPVGSVATADALTGQLGTLVHPIAPGRTSKIRLEGPGHASRELLAVLAADSPPLPVDARVIVLGFDAGRAVIQAAEPDMLPSLAAERADA
jgi:hypothetical protein